LNLGKGEKAVKGEIRNLERRGKERE